MAGKVVAIFNTCPDTMHLGSKNICICK